MERQRNRPEKYNRELVQKTVKAMEKITEVSATTPIRYPPVVHADPAASDMLCSRRSFALIDCTQIGLLHSIFLGPSVICQFNYNTSRVLSAQESYTVVH